MTNKCWSCSKPLEDSIFIDRRVPFRALCDHCNSWLHCCRGCRHYKPGMANDCMVPDTDPVYEREKNNYCESFSLLGKAHQKGPSPDEVSKRLFND